MSLGPCIPGLVQRGEVSPEQGAEMARLYDDLTAQYARELGQDAAAAMASRATLDEMDRRVLRQRENAARTIRTQQRNAGDMRRFGGGGGDGPIDPRAGPAFLGGDGRAPYSNVEGRWAAVRARAHTMIDRVLQHHSSNVLGQTRNRADLMDLAREAFGRDSGNLSAREFFDAWMQSAEMLRSRFNAAGGNIGFREDWGLPQGHNAKRMRDAGFEQWRALVRDSNGGQGLLNRQAMVDARTGRPMTDDALDAALTTMFQRVVSDGAVDRLPGESLGRGILANQRDDARFLVFNSAEDWDTYAAHFGTGNAFDAMMSHIDGMSRDIAFLEILGPNPEAGMQHIKDTILHSAQMDMTPGSRAVERARASAKQMDRLYNELTGESRRPENERIALAFGTVRSLQTAAKLGGATVSALTDTAFQFSARRYNGLPVTSILPGYVKMLASPENHALAVRLGLIGSEWASRTAGQNRFMGEELTGEVSRRMAETVLRVSGLNHWTQAGRWAFGMELLGHITNESVKRFDALDPPFARMLQRYGIGEGEWDQIRSTALEIDNGVPWLKPTNVENQGLGDRLLEMIQRETDFAVPTADIRTRAMMSAMTPAGTFPGEIVKTAGLFKSFGISMMVMQGSRIMEQSVGSALRYTAGLVAATTLVGGMVLLAKDVLAGRDPREMFDKHGRIRWDFWGQATLQGGGFGMAGDFIRASEDRTGGGVGSMLAGPVIGDIEKLARVPGKGWEGRAFKLARSEMPGGSLWYSRLALDRAVADQIQEAVDPKYRQSWRRMDKWAKEQGTDFFWEPGDTLGQARAPDFENIGQPASDAETLLGIE